MRKTILTLSAVALGFAALADANTAASAFASHRAPTASIPFTTPPNLRSSLILPPFPIQCRLVGGRYMCNRSP